MEFNIALSDYLRVASMVDGQTFVLPKSRYRPQEDESADPLSWEIVSTDELLDVLCSWAENWNFHNWKDALYDVYSAPETDEAAWVALAKYFRDYHGEPYPDCD